MSHKVWRSKFSPGSGLAKALAETQNPGQVVYGPIQSPPSELQDLVGTDAGGDGYTLASFTVNDAWELGHFLYARLLPMASSRPALISISLANGNVLFQAATGPGTVPDNSAWVARKRNTVLRFGVSSWFVGCKFDGDEAAFAAKYGLNPERAGDYSIHGGGIPIRVDGVEGVVAVVVVSGLKQHEDHGVIAETIQTYWEPV